MKIILAISVLALCVFGLCFNIIFKKDGKFPDGEISHNKYLRSQGIICAKEEERRLWKKNGGKGMTENRASSVHDGSNCPEGGCEGCAFYETLINRRN